MKQALLRSPLLHFMLLGGLLYGACGWRNASHIQAGQALSDEQILLREAQRLSLNRSDPVVRGRLLQNLRFAYPDAEASDAELLKQALALGMDERDLVTRRRLIQLMQQRLATETRISDAELQAFVAAHPERYAEAARIGFQQVFVDADRHGHDLAATVRNVQARLQQEDISVLGDPFLGGSRYSDASETEIAKIFGEDFAVAAMRATPQVWTGPIRSSYGLHFIRVASASPARAADFAAVRARAYYALLEQHEHSSLDAAMTRLRQHYAAQVWP